MRSSAQTNEAFIPPQVGSYLVESFFLIRLRLSLYLYVGLRNLKSCVQHYAGEGDL